MLKPCLASIIGVICVAALNRPAAGGGQSAQSTPAEIGLRSFLQNYDGGRAGGRDPATRYIAAFADLDGDGAPEAIVYLTGPWCGSGGCTTLILEPTDSSFRVVAKITVTWAPIRVLPSTSHGWRDIAVFVHGGGILKAYNARLSFDGKTYPVNPSTPPAVHLTGKITGRIVVPESAEGIPLYP
jgi:hypothetical protein